MQPPERNNEVLGWEAAAKGKQDEIKGGIDGRTGKQLLTNQWFDAAYTC